jgi:hypothetical protein
MTGSNGNDNNQISSKEPDFATSFAKVKDSLIATNDRAWNSSYFRSYTTSTRDYKPEEIKRIVESGSLEEQQKLSRNYFLKDGIYKKLILYYATLLDYAGLLIPNPSFGQNLSTSHLQKRYQRAIDFIDSVPLRNIFVGFSQRALVDGCYYGVISELDKNVLSIIDLPPNYCATNFKDELGNDIVEFNVAYFDTIHSEAKRKEALNSYPKFIVTAYRKYKKGKGPQWILIPSDVGVCFPALDGRPMFLSAIEACVEYDNAIDIEQARALENIRKILVQEIPHLSDGTLLFEPDEVQLMHEGAVGMMKGNRNVSVLTTYGNVEAVASSSSADTINNTLDRMYKNIYNNAGVSSELFCSTGSATLAASIKMDISIMMTFATRYAFFTTQLVNQLFANNNISFKYTIYPVCEQNRKEFVDICFKLAQSGYSLLMPAIAMGFSQRDILNVKALENDVLNLTEKFIPLNSSYTQSTRSIGANPVGAPKKTDDEKAPQTLKNDESANNTGEIR